MWNLPIFMWDTTTNNPLGFRQSRPDGCIQSLLPCQLITSATYSCVACFSLSISSLQSFSSVPLFATPRTAARQASLSITNSWSLLKLMSIMWWCHPTISSSIIPFPSCFQSFPALGYFLMSQFFTSKTYLILLKNCIIFHHMHIP